LIEAAASGCPVIVGPHTFNFLQATEDAIAAGAARRVDDEAGLAAAISQAFGNAGELAEMHTAALRFAAAHRGATKRTVSVIRAAIAAA
ncbi:MAG: 3-deoxy-D-manno-octulosonic acid transferase, partial [Azonexus sp.]